MHPQQWQRVKEIFARIVEAPPDRRAALLQELCAHDPDLRAEVESLVAADEQTDRLFLPDALRPGPAAETVSYAGRSLGIEVDYNWNWAAADGNHRRALELAPNSAAAHHSYSEFLARMGRFTEAAAHSDLAQQLDPTRMNYVAVRALHYYYEHRFTDAIAQSTKAIEQDPSTYLAHLYLSTAYAAQGDYAAGVEAARRASALTGGALSDLFVLGCNLALMNDRTGADRVLQRMTLMSRDRYVDPFLFVAIHTYLGNADQAFAHLERSYAGRSYWMTTLKVHPIVGALRGDARFGAMMRRMALD